jgi:TatD DNase family protein
MIAPTALELVDSHAHIQSAEFAAELETVINRARTAGVAKIVVIGGAGELSSNLDAVKLAESVPGLFATVGVHPHDADGLTEEAFLELSRLVAREKVVAIGETGLDFYYNHSARAAQTKWFARFIGLARETRLPLVVHDRDAHREVAGLIRDEGRAGVGGVIHCFTGDYEAAKEFLDLGFYLSFSGIVTFKNADSLRDVARKVPLERILIETDSPYLAPAPHRGKRNEPAYVRLVAETIARLRGLSLEEIAQSTSRAARRLFRLGEENL